MSAILFNIIKDRVYRSDEIKKVSLDSRGSSKQWIFDFKGQGLSPIFLREYAGQFWNIFGNKYGDRIQIGGMETGAIPLIAGTVLSGGAGIEVTSFYIRKSRKKSDLANRIEGDVHKDVPLILVDDILNHGYTVKKQIKILEESGYRVSAIFVCLRFRDLSQYQDLTDKGIEIFSIFELNDFSAVLPVKNIADEPLVPLAEKYVPEYKVTLTDKPNLYAVIPKSAPLLVGEHLYLGADDGTFYCLRADDGSVVWTYKVLFGDRAKRIFSSPVVYEDRVFFGAYDGNLYCLDRFTGKREWVFIDADWVGSSPCVDAASGIVYIGLEFGLFNKRGGIAAVDARTGRAKWKNYTMAGLTHASPAYNKRNNIVVCGCNDNNFYAFNAGTGEIVWKFRAGAEIKYGAVFDIERNLVVFASLDGGVYALHAKNGALYHRFEARFGFYSTPVLHGDSVIIGSLDKNVYCFNLATKKTDWVFETHGRIFASPALDGNSVFIGSNDGRLYEIAMDSGKALSAIQLSERIVNKIQISTSPDGKRILYIPTHTCELYKMKEK